ncbi:hypothetical protein [Bradyrhizobium sp. CB3481]|uniref:hypothetical protein n=1 Tax=Bradyrhizobium sp. CB3481 TaxID=3039158 RepID=UPI0024B1B216|nr:hypothetical protein [Bradyrhizobium sp. CB3481]WFU13452.1 hypothetical protein QA643_19505 [Bradyrhizobium sp. CB3481]
MALHRDILWIGRQWAVTGHGMQLIDQRLMGVFDIEVADLWDDDLIARIHAKAWLNSADFDKGLAVARARHRPPEAEVELPSAALIPMIDSIEASPPPQPERPLSVEPAPITPAPPAAPIPPLLPAESVKQASPDLQMKMDGAARFARPWRVWMKKT